MLFTYGILLCWLLLTPTAYLKWGWSGIVFTTVFFSACYGFVWIFCRAVEVEEDEQENTSQGEQR